MIFINTLRMVADLSIYFFFAEFIAISLGGKSMLIEMLLLCLCFGVLVRIQKFSQNRIFLLLPALILFLPKVFGLTLANRIILIAPIIYIMFLILKEEYGLSWDRQSDLFSISWKVFLGAGICFCLSGNYQPVLSYSLPIAFISLFASVLLMRMLRHEPDVYLNRQYQLKNILLLGCVLFIAWLSSRKFVLDTVVKAFNFIYMSFMVPIFTFFITCVVAVLKLFMKLFSWIKFGDINLADEQVSQSGEMNMFSDLDQTVTQSGEIFKSVLTVIVVLLLILAAFLFFRWLASNREKEDIILRDLDISRNPETGASRGKREYASTTALQVRHQYRKFLKLYKAHGVQIKSSDTSETIASKGSEIFLTPDEMEEMREIYIRARYGNQATRTDLKRVKQINQMLK